MLHICRVSLYVLRAALLLGSLLLSLSCTQNYNVHIVSLGLVAPLSGDAHLVGADWVFAARRAIDEWNAAGEAVPFRVRLVIYDQAEGPVLARRLAVDPSIMGVAGFWQDGPAGDARKTLADAALPLISLAPPLTREAGAEGPASLHLLPPQGDIYRGIGAFLRENLKNESAVLVIGPTVQDLARARGFQEQMSKAGITDMRVQAAGPYASDYSSVLSRSGGASSETILFSGAAASAQDFLQQLASSELSPDANVVLLPDAHPLPSADATPRGGAYWMTGAGGQPTDKGKALIDAFQEEKGRQPYPSAMTAYDGVELLLQGLATAWGARQRLDRAGVAEFLRRTTVYHGLAQQYEFDGRGMVINPSVYAYRLKKGMFPGELAAKVSVPPAAR